MRLLDSGEQTPSPWAIAVAVLALLGFGVLVGTTVSPAQSSPSAVLLANARSAAARGDAATPPSAKPEATPSAPSSEGAGESGEESGKESGGEGGATKSSSGAGKKGKEAGGASGGGQGKEGAAGGGAEPSAGSLPPIRHVFLIVLSEQGYGTSFGGGPSAPYLARTLTSEGELLQSYYAVAGGEPANGIALISGQGPTPQTQQGCALYADIAPGDAGAEGQTLGNGCVYPSTTPTIANQLEAAGKTWRAYIEGIEASGPGPAAGTAGGCPHPQLGASDPDSAPNPANGYATWRNPFVYFHSLTDGSACAHNDVGIGQLATDLADPSKTPSLVYIAPGACDDGSQTPCRPGAPAGMAPAETFLRTTVPEIERSAAYKQGGLIAITFDHAPQSGPGADAGGCCISAPYPNLPSSSPTTGAPASTTTAPATNSAPTATAGATSTPGGGKVGLLLISKYVKPGSLNALGEYDHFSLLLTIEKLFDLKPLGYAGAKGLLAFDASVFNAKR